MIGGEEIYKGFQLTATKAPAPATGYQVKIDTIPAGRSVLTMPFPTAFEAMAAARRIIDNGVMG
jgi:hypothetical protein